MGKYSTIFNKSRNMGDAIDINQLRDVSNRVLHKPFTGDISTAWCWEAKKTIWGGTCGVSTVQVRTNKYEQHMSIIAHNFGAATSKSERLSNDGCTMEIKEIKPLEFNRSMQQIADNCNIKHENCEPSRMGISIYIYMYICIYIYTHGKRKKTILRGIWHESITNLYKWRLDGLKSTTSRPSFAWRISHPMFHMVFPQNVPPDIPMCSMSFPMMFQLFGDFPMF